MPNTRWKSVERTIARHFDTNRIPRDGSNTVDFKTTQIIAEVKTRTNKSNMWGFTCEAKEAIEQVEKAALRPGYRGLIPITILHTKGRRSSDSFVILRAKHLASLLRLLRLHKKGE